MQLYNLGQVSWQDSQLLYHALPRLGRSGLFLLAPQTPYVCIGYHQNAVNEVDLDYCTTAGIPVFRREVGGGAVYLDGNQIFYQLVVPQDHELLQTDRATFFHRALQPPIRTLNTLGLDAEYKPVNDILVCGRKITGSGIAEIADHVVFVGNILLDFDFTTMVKVLKVPDSKFRDKLYTSLESNLTTCRRELGEAPKVEEVYRLLEEHFSTLLGSLEHAAIDESLRTKATQLGKHMLTFDWLNRRGRQQKGRLVTVRNGVELTESMHKTPGGLIRATAEIDHNTDSIRSASFSGDFFIFPTSGLVQLEESLEMCPFDDMLNRVEQVYISQSIDSPGVLPKDWVSAVRAALR